TGAIVRACAAETFVRLEAGLLADAGPAMVVAELQGDSMLLGRHQRSWSAQGETIGPLGTYRRAGGGEALLAGDGVVAIAPGLPGLTGGAEKAMHRGVGGLSGGGLGFGPAGALFGRVSVGAGGAEVAVVSQEGTRPVLFEAYVSVSGTLRAGPGRYPEHAGRS